MPRTVQQTLADPQFYGLPSGEQQKVLATLDPNYARLPLAERTKVLQMGQARLGTASTATPTATPGVGGDLRVPTDRERFLNPDLYPVGLKDEGIGENLKNLAQRAGVGVFQFANAAVHPKQTVASILASLLPEPAVHAANKVVDLENRVPGAHYLTTHLPEQTTNPLQQAYSAMATSRGPMEVAGKAAPLAGQALAGEAFSVAAPEILYGKPASGASAASFPPYSIKGIGESAARAATGTGKGPVEELVKTRQAKNKTIDAANAEAKSNNQAAAQALDLRRQHEQVYQQATAEHYAKEAAADTRAKAEENAAWTAWREKIAGKTLDGGQITGPLQKLRLDSPEVDRTLNQLEPRGDEVPQESPYAQIREHTSQQQFGTDYKSLSPVKQDQVDDLLHGSGYSPEPITFDPQAGQPISIDRVQRASSILQRYIRSGRFEGPLLGEMKQVAKILHNAVTRGSTDAGAAADLSAARDATITYQGAFGRERRSPTTARSVREQQANPEAFRERSNEERLTRTRRYDPTLVDSYRNVKTARDALKKLPSEEQLRKGLKPITSRQTISAGDITAAREVAAEASAGKWWRRGRWAAAVPIFQAMRAFWGGHIPSIPMMGLESAGVMATTKAFVQLLRYPPMVRFLSEARPEDLALIPPDLRGDLPGLVNIAQRQGIKVAPALVAVAGAGQQPQITPAQAIQAMQPESVGAPQ